MALQIKIDGILRNLDDIDGTEGLVFTYRRKDESGDSGLAFAPQLEITGDTFTYLYNQLVNVPNQSLTSVTFTAYDECCDVMLFDGLIRGSDVQHCEIPNCVMTVTVIDNSQDAQALTCLKNIFPWSREDKFDGSGVSDGEDTFRTAPLTDYCIDVRPGFLQEIILILGITTLVVLFPVAIVIGAILTAVNFFIVIFGGTPIGDGDINAIDDALFVFELLRQIIIGCGYKHKTPFIHSYMRNMCDICGLNLQSSLFNFGGPYHNTMRLDAPYKPGRRNDARTLENWEENKPNLNGIQFLDTLNQFNIKWEVSGNALIIERKDFNAGNLWFDASTLDPETEIISLCFDPDPIPPPAFAEYQYTKDGVDNTGDETNSDWVERAIDWNSPPNPAQSGLFSKTFTFGSAQFRKDSGRDGVSALDKPVYSVFYPILNDFQGVMLMERGICALPRLLQWDGTSSPLNARVLRYVNANDTTVFDYNTDWWVKLNYPTDTLYQRLLEIDDPRATGFRNKVYTITVTATCDIIRGIDLDGIVRIPQGGNVFDGTVEEVTYNYTRNEITITGRI